MMPRVARVKSGTGVYHIMLRGNNRQAVFKEDEDCEIFKRLLQKYKAVCEFEIYAYCFMGNHLHLLLKVGTEPLERIMRRLGGSYVRWYNKKYDRIGNLFQDRFKSEPVEDISYLLTVIRYIHQNPIKADMVRDIKEYEWSSYNEYIHGETLVDVDFILSLFFEDRNKALRLFRNHMEEIQNDSCLEMEERHRISDREAMVIIKKESSLSNPSQIQKLDIQKRDAVLKRLKNSGLSIRQIGRLTGINRGIIQRA